MMPLMPFLALLACLPFMLLASNLEKVERKAFHDIKLLNYQNPPWKEPQADTVDVAIIGGGMAGCSAAFALKMQGITSVCVFDAADGGKEGPWLTYARMRVLRTGKTLQGPALGIPHLTFQAWYKGKYGKQALADMQLVPTAAWGEYLIWLRQVLAIPLQNGYRLYCIAPQANGSLRLEFNGDRHIYARKVVLATGREGCGGYELPAWVQKLPKDMWRHTGEDICQEFWKNKRVVVIGAGASAYDAAGAALEEGAQTVVHLVRRSSVPTINKFAGRTNIISSPKFYFLSDEERASTFRAAWEAAIPPPLEALKRLEPFANHKLLTDCTIEDAWQAEQSVYLQTNLGTIGADVVVLGTGYAIDLASREELQAIAPYILLWNDRLSGLPAKLGRFPYLGVGFEFLEKTPGEAPYLHNIHCFNYGAFLSHGRMSGDIDGIHIGLARLAEAIAFDLRRLD